MAVVAAVVGAVLVLSAAWSVFGTIVVPRRVRSLPVVAVDRVVGAFFAHLRDTSKRYERRDRLGAAEGPALLIANLMLWLLLFEVGFSLLLWSLGGQSLGSALAETGSSLTQLGYLTIPRGDPAGVVDDLAGLVALVTIALQIGYLPTLYGAFNRRETEVTLLDARAGVPSWGPELLARTHYGLGSGVSALGSLPDLFRTWERWAADVAESHSTYTPLVRFRSPRPLSSWVTGLLAVLDAAALYLAVFDEPADPVAARLCLRSGFTCFNTVARALGTDIPAEANPADGIQLSFGEFEEAVRRLQAVDVPVQRTAGEAWPDFVGWRVNYERAAYTVAAAVDAPPALWSGPRRRQVEPIPPKRPLTLKRRPGEH
ncbi:MAG: hypothetical protein J2P43_01410 [Candidatus Dormibacteraeota bacterium]|nr:hypothetical protein [Candidatus Dormibacteraeota bacterium]MBO0743646.1 hypothetical protein [Candidatus Dormibacteraeota bacterium]